jgi:MFS family permease
LNSTSGGRTFMDMNRYQWTVLFAAWLGWGFDVFDGLLFNYVAPTCVPTLLGIPLGTPEAKAAALQWTGILTSVLLVGWAVGGVVFGAVADRLGRTRTLLLTMLLYALGTAACAFAPNIWVLLLCRIVASLGIGGEWAAGASMVAEVVPEHRRVDAGALLYTSAPVGLFLATYVTWFIQGVAFSGSPEVSWRYVFLCGLIPAVVAFLVRLFVKEPERWQAAAHDAPPKIRELFSPALRSRTLSGLGMAVTALLMWWSCNAFLPLVASGLAAAEAKTLALEPQATTKLMESWKAIATNSFNLGGLIGTLLTVPVSKIFGRRVMFGAYFLASAAAILATFGLDMPGETRLYMYFLIGLTVFGVFGSFTYYLPELYPTRLRGTGAGFCYNAGRIIAAGGPFLVGHIASQGADSLKAALGVLFWVGAVPLLGMLLLPWVHETRDVVLED